MKLLCVDQGTTTSGVVVLEKEGEILYKNSEFDNYKFVKAIEEGWFDYTDLMVIEKIESQGMAVGQTTFETCVWAGRMIEAYLKNSKAKSFAFVPRREVKMTICGDSRAKDKNIRQAILDMYPATGAGKIPQIGTKKKPGMLYGVSSHAWSALAVGITYVIQLEEYCKMFKR